MTTRSAGTSRFGGPRRRGAKRRFFPRRRVCYFCADKVSEIDYKDVAKLRRYLTDRGKMQSRSKSGTCARHQRWLAVAIKRARFLALLPYTAAHLRLSGGVVSKE